MRPDDFDWDNEPEYQDKLLGPNEPTNDDVEPISPEEEQEFLSDARLRLEQARLYETLMQHGLFAEDIGANPRAVAKVEREIRAYVKERLEILLGMREESKRPSQGLDSQFTPLEVDLLKRAAAKMTNGATQSFSAPPPATPAVKKIGAAQTPKPVLKARPAAPQQQLVRPARKSEPERPSRAQPERRAEKKESLEEASRRISEEQRARKAAVPADRMPQPDAQQSQIIYAGQQEGAQTMGGILGKRLIGKFVTSDVAADDNE
jgi:hypothetical protein